jgi:hypothetical protein
MIWAVAQQLGRSLHLESESGQWTLAFLNSLCTGFATIYLNRSRIKLLYRTLSKISKMHYVYSSTCSVREICGAEDVDIGYRHFKAFYELFSAIDKQVKVDH